MGYSTDMAGRLCCDNCGHAGGCRKVNCPYGYCPRPALCAACRKDPAVKAKLAAYHEDNCREAAAEYAAREARKAALVEAGHMLNTANLSVEDDAVKMWFRGTDGEKALIVGRADYKRLREGGIVGGIVTYAAAAKVAREKVAA